MRKQCVLKDNNIPYITGQTNYPTALSFKNLKKIIHALMLEKSISFNIVVTD